VVVESLAEEFDIVDVAAAAVKMAHAASSGDGEDREIPAAVPSAPGAPRHVGRPAAGKPPGARREHTVASDGPTVRLFISAGRQAGIRPGDLVGAITGEAGVTGGSLGAIEIADRFSLVEVPDALADDIIAALRTTMIRGNKVTVRRER
jgi:ATP-dependent RNA helicase DeaD